MILNELRSRTGINFQSAVSAVLKAYYYSHNLTYEVPSPYGGDDKNDGWVKEHKLFYQIYSPPLGSVSQSFNKSIRNKFSTDLEGLLNKIKDGMWGGEIEHFVFIVNTHDDELPKDPENFYQNKVDSLIREYKFNFDYKLTNTSYIQDLLMKMDQTYVLASMLSNLEISNIPPQSSVNDLAMGKFLKKLVQNLARDSLIQKDLGTDYKRISSPRKIAINDLTPLSEEIKRYLGSPYISVQKSFKNIESNPSNSDQITILKNYVIEEYQNVCKETDIRAGVSLFKELCSRVATKSGDCTQVISAEALVVFIFDACDIFIKENVNDTSE